MDGYTEGSSRVKLAALVSTIGLLSAALGFAAEATKVQLAEVQDPLGRGCIYPSHSGPMGLGLMAVVTLLAFRVYCPGIRRSSLSLVLLSRYLSWVASLAAMSSYIIGLWMMGKQGNTISYRESYAIYYECNVVKPCIFGAGATFALTGVVFEIIYMVVTDRRSDNTTTEPSTSQPKHSHVLSICS